MIQRLIHRQFPQHHDLRDSQGRLAMGRIEHGGEVAEHFAGRAQGFAGVGEQRFGVVGRVGEEHRFRLVGRAHDMGAGVEVVIEGAVGGVVEFSGVD